MKLNNYGILRAKRSCLCMKRNIMLLVFAFLAVPVMGVFLAIVAYGTNSILILLNEFGLSTSDWFTALASIFGGVVAAVAIYLAFTQADRLHKKNQEYLIREKTFHQKMTELKELSYLFTDMIGNALSINTMPLFSNVPLGEAEILQRKHMIYELYSLTEKNYSMVFVTGTLYDYCTECAESREEKDLIESQVALAEEYRLLYHLLHDFINLRLNQLDLLCSADGLWIWEIKEKMKSDIASEINHYGEILSEMQTAIITNTKMEVECKENINSSAGNLRELLSKYICSYKLFEEKLLEGKLLNSKPSCTHDRLGVYIRYCEEHKRP